MRSGDGDMIDDKRYDHGYSCYDVAFLRRYPLVVQESEEVGGFMAF
jgi:hypothetical protein